MSYNYKSFREIEGFFILFYLPSLSLLLKKFISTHKPKTMLPWGQLIPTAISIAEMAGKILSSNKKEKAKTEGDHSFDPASLLKRIETLEKNELKQAELIQQMAQQILGLTKKSKANYTLAAVSLGFSLLVTLLVFLLIFDVLS